MLKAKAPSPIPYLVVAIVLLLGGYFWFQRDGNSFAPTDDLPSSQMPSSARSPAAVSPPDLAEPDFAPPTSVPAGTVVRVDGSTSMVTLNQNLKQAFERQFPGTQVFTQANGSTRGIQDLLAGRIDVAATSRALTPAEANQGARVVGVATDAIAVIVGNNNPFKGGLTPQQVQGIFQGTIVNWSQVGGPNRMIRVINRPPISGTHQAFKEQVLQGGTFGSTSNITTLPQDATTPLIRALGEDGIGYATAKQVMNQQTVRVVPLGEKLPDHPDYPYRRSLYYVHQNPPNEAAKAFLGFALSPAGQQAMEQQL